MGKSSVPKGEESLRASLIYAGQGAEDGRNNLATNPAFQGIDNGIHLSDSPEAGRRESQIWFSPSAKNAIQPPPATPDLAEAVPGLPRQVRKLTEKARTVAIEETETFLPEMRTPTRKAGLRLLPTLAGDAVRPMPRRTLETVPTDLLSTTLQDGNTEEELMASTARLLPALQELGYYLAGTAENEAQLQVEDEGNHSLTRQRHRNLH